MVVGEIAVHCAKELNDLAADSPQNARRRGPGYTVARIDHDFERPVQTNIADDAGAVSGQHIVLAAPTAVLQHPAGALHHLAQGLDFGAINRLAGQHHFETVVIARVVAACHLNTALA